MTKAVSEMNKLASSNASSVKTTPKDAQIMAAILKDMSITDYEPRVIHQMIEFTYRYVSSVLEEAQYFSNYAKKKTIDADDVRLAIQLQVDKGFTGPPPKDLLQEIARTKNNQNLPPIKSHNGPRLPADRYSLVACNMRQKTMKSKPSQPSQISLPFRSSISGTSLLTTGTNATVIKPMTTLTPSARTAAQTVSIQMPSRLTTNSTVTIKTQDPQPSVKRKLDES